VSRLCYYVVSKQKIIARKKEQGKDLGQKGIERKGNGKRQSEETAVEKSKQKRQRDKRQYNIMFKK
jgi:hypothetical protein